jgi:hypothetical protein
VRQATYQGRALGDEQFVAELTEKLGRDVQPRRRGRPPKKEAEDSGVGEA